jgi:hypothetical protein
MGSGQENITVESVNKNTIKEKHTYNKVYFRTYKLLKGGSHYIGKPVIPLLRGESLTWSFGFVCSYTEIQYSTKTF